MKTLADALELLMPTIAPLGCERVPLSNALDRYAATELRAQCASPPFDNSAMDGYALSSTLVQNATVENPVVLPISQESRAGTALPNDLQAGTCARIFTGAPIPPDADCVVIQENTERRGEEVVIFSSALVGQHIRKSGSDFEHDSVILPQQRRIGPMEIGMLASQDIVEVPVFTKPTVAIFSTGDELRPVGSTKRAGTIANSNAHTLAAMVREAGGTPICHPIVADDTRRDSNMPSRRVDG